MSYLIVLATLSSVAFSQPKLTVTAPAQIIAGTQVTATVVLSGSSGNVAAIQDVIAATPPVALTVPSSSAPGKSTVCAPGSSSLTCLVIGEVPPPTVDPQGNVTSLPGAVFNSTPIPDGSQVQMITFSVPSSMAIGSTLTITAGGTVGADAAGNLVIVAGSSATMTVTTLVAIADQAWTAWRASPTQANFAALVKAIAAVQQ